MEKEIILKEVNGKIVTTSREIGLDFEKKHGDVVRAVNNTIEGLCKIANTPIERYFIESEYINPQNNQKYKEYLLTRDGFILTAMGFTGSKALEWKVKYIDAFNKMEETLKNIQNNPKSLSNENNMNQTLLLVNSTLDEVKSLTMQLTHKDKLNITKNIIYPKLLCNGVKEEHKKVVTKMIKETLITNGKWENIRLDDNFSLSQFKEDVDKLIPIIKSNNHVYFNNSGYEMVGMF